MGAAAIVGGAAVAGAAGSVISSSNAAGASEAAAADQEAAATAAQQSADNNMTLTRENIQPFLDAGTSAEATLMSQLGTLTTPYASTSAGAWNPTEEGLEATPGYQFTKQQGLESVQNSYAAQGLASSGAAIKGAASYATGLADSTYQQQYANYLSGQSAYLAQNQQEYNMLGGIAGSGQNAASGLGSLDLASTGQSNAALTAGAAAQAAGTVGAANATNAGITGTTNAIGSGLSNYATLSALQNSGLFGSGGTSSGGGWDNNVQSD